MPKNSVPSDGDRRPLIVLLTIMAIFAAMLGCGGGGGGGGGGTNANATATATATTSTATTNATTTSETTGSTGSALPVNRIFFQDAAFDVKHVAVNGTDEQLFADLDTAMDGFAQNPAPNGAEAVVAFGLTTNPGPSATYSIYGNTTANSSGAQKLTATSWADIGSVMFTPDGSKIVFTGATKTGTGEQTQLRYRVYIIDSATGGQSPVAVDDADDAFVAFNGQKIVYTCWPPAADNPRIKVCNMDGTGKAFLTVDTQVNLLPQYNKTGTEISFTSNRGGSFEIWKMASNGDTPTQVTDMNSSISDRCLGSSFSGPGTDIAFTRITLSGATSGVYTVPAAGGSEVQIRSGSVQANIFWTPPSAAPISRAPGGTGVNGFGTSHRVLELLGLSQAK